MIEQTSAPTGVPIRVEAVARSRAVLESVVAAAYTDEGVCERLGIESVFDYQTLDWASSAPSRIESPLDALIHLFLAGRAMEAGLAATHLGDGLVGGLKELGLLAEDDTAAGMVTPTVLFYPAGDQYFVSDLGADPVAALEPGSDTPVLPSDSVYPAIARNTGKLLSLLPHDRCESFLDLCSGTAIAALVASRFADHAWAVDVTERSTRFAEFNVALNDVPNVTVLQGDLYGPVSDRTFDFIVAHPPYVPSRGSNLIYRFGGHDGEHITRRVIEGLPDRLRPGGRFYCSCLLSDRREGTVERRLRAMLGADQREFDIFIVTETASEPEEFFSRHTPEPDATVSVETAVEELTALGVERLVLCTVVIRRHIGDSPPVTARRQAGERTGRDEMDWLIEFETAAVDPGLPDRLVPMRPQISPAVRLELVSRPGGGTWVPERCTLRTDWPFERVIEVPLEVAQFVIGCDGGLTIADHLARAKSEGLAPDDLTATAFAASLMPLIASGVLAFPATD